MSSDRCNFALQEMTDASKWQALTVCWKMSSDLCNFALLEMTDASKWQVLTVDGKCHLTYVQLSDPGYMKLQH